MTAFNLYLSTCRYVMRSDPVDRNTWSDLYRYLPYLRQVLSCCVCGNIISKPRGPTHNVCQHNVCTRCVGGKMRLKPSCSWCKDHSEFTDNKQLRILVLCFKKLCEYIYSSQIGSEIASSASNGETNSLLLIIQEAMTFDDDYVMNTKLPNLPMPVLTPMTNKRRRGRRPMGYKQAKTETKESTSSLEPPTLAPCDVTGPSDSHGNDINVSALAPVIDGKEDNVMADINKASTVVLDNSSKVGKAGSGSKSEKAGQKADKNAEHESSAEDDTPKTAEKLSASRSSKHVLSFEPPSKRTRAAVSSPDMAKRRICKCARNNQPNRLTCLGQRCPCYSSHMPCVGCLCRGCRNPRRHSESQSSSEGDAPEQNITQCRELSVCL